MNWLLPLTMAFTDFGLGILLELWATSMTRHSMNFVTGKVTLIIPLNSRNS